jgi:hypothetical protein
MGLFGFLKSLFARPGRDEPPAPPRFTVDDVGRRLGIDAGQLRAVTIAYTRHQIPKRSGGVREIHSPSAELKAVQRRILRRLLHGLRVHPCATGFERGHSIVSNALPHAGKDVVIRLDLKDFFPSVRAERVRRYFRFIGYDDEAAELLTRLCTYEGSLPQGAPTSPRLSNLVSYRLDTRLAGLAEGRGLSYSRYADDITLSARFDERRPTLRTNPKTLGKHNHVVPRVNDIIRAGRAIIEDEGYRVHTRGKLRIYRRHHRQRVTGLVVNRRPNLSRETRRRLRAIEHHLRTGRPASLTAEQLAGWRSLQAMIMHQTLPYQQPGDMDSE